jgi:hypothetical protein
MLAQVAPEPAAGAQSLPVRTGEAPTSDAARGAVTGTVRGHFQGETRALGYAVVEASAGAVRRAAVADSLGHYRIEDLPPGQVRLRVTHAGHESLALVVLVSPESTVSVDLELRATPVELPALEVEGDRRVREPNEPALGTGSLPELEVQALDVGPGSGHAGLVDAVESLPGNDPEDPTDVLLMRGAASDLKLVLLDGVPVYTPFHVAGLLRSFEPAVLGSADLHVGGAPARYDGGLSHILELRTRDARRDRVRASGSVDLLSASAAVESPLGEHAGIIASGRSLHDLGAAALGGPRPYGYRDLLFAVDAEPGAGHELRATGFWNRESVLLDFERVSDDASWSNRAGSVGYRTDLGAAVLDLSAGASGYNARLPLQPSAQPGQPPREALLATAETERLRFVAEVAWGRAEAPIRAGASYEHIGATFGARTLNGGPSVSNRGSTGAAGLFFDATRPLAPGVTVRAGVRLDRFGSRTTRLAPRGALSWEVGPSALLTVAAGRYHQPTRTPDVEVERTLVDVVQTETLAQAESVELHPVATADHVVLSLDQRLGERIQLGLEGFWKRYEGLRATPRETVRSSGLDLRLVSAGDRVAGWFSYGLSWFWSTADLSGRTSEFAGRHFLSGGLSGRLAGPIHAEARVGYGAGLPYTSIPFPGSVASDGAPATDQSLTGSHAPQSTSTRAPLVEGLDEEFLRIDLEIQAVLEPDWGGRPWRVRPYVRLLNALDRRDALFYTFQPWRDESATPLAERSILPLLGVAFSF